MNLTLNGESQTFSDGTELINLLSEIGLADQPCAVEVNGQVVPKREHEACSLSEGDVIEIVTLVGGG